MDLERTVRRVVYASDWPICLQGAGMGQCHGLGLSDLELLKEVRSECNMVRRTIDAESVYLKAEKLL